jgi:acyl-CoA synthetase (AMP-forming)/AMP-acid ligase II
MLSHRNLVFLALTQQQCRRYTEQDRTYCPLPLAHVGALSILLCVVAAGACLQLEPRFLPAQLARAIRQDGISVVPGLPPLHRKFVEWVAENPQDFERGRVRLVTTSSSPLSGALKRQVEALYGCPLQNSYGSTESGIVFQTEVDRWRDDTSVGAALPGVSVRIADVEGNEVRPGVRGEILVRGPSVFRGYYRGPEVTRAAFTADGWLRSGDIGYVDAAGNAFITGRARDTIRRSGYSLYPAEIEAALNDHPLVAQSAVVAAQRAADEEVVAFVEPKRHTPVDPPTLLEFLKVRLAPYELPGHIRLLDALPTLTNGKTDRALLRRLAGEITS